ncbi:YggS family pyridoxal phosphate-dependent enzyme [Candidatus Woesearchaeota archaeon]|nr:YggS family pyridoxal phosphate-dependent enzyme [Candidatus Woesearchaeota archaeon]
MTIAENVRQLKKIVPSSVRILAAAKSQPIEKILEAIRAGIAIIGENYIQEAEEKFPFLKGKADFHCIGHLQTNKVSKAVKIFGMIQTVDSLKLAEALSRECKKQNKTMPILIEVNSAKEAQKNGAFPEEVESLAEKISALPNLSLRGLMTMGPVVKDPEQLRLYFRLTKKLFDKLKSTHLTNTSIEILSMGMSDSFQAAIEEGATMVRLGAKIFGQR